MKNRCLKRCFFISLLYASTLTAGTINDYVETIKSSPNALYAFFKAMPKGGELHYHLAGSSAPETMLSLATQDDYCIDDKTFSINKSTLPCEGVSSKTLTTQTKLYDDLIRSWSMTAFTPAKESAHDHFFASFFKFMPLAWDFEAPLLADSMQRAANQHEHYLEILISPDQAKSTTFAPRVHQASGFQEKKERLLADPAFQKNIKLTIIKAKHLLNDARDALGCNVSSHQEVCQLKVKFQYYVLREQPLENVFAQALNGFEAASKSNELVGVNLVQAEDGQISLRDYKAQMRIFNFLHRAYPDVNIALHAGELSPALVKPKHLRSHIHDAIFTGHAQRIGHGVGITHETQSDALLKHMAKQSIPVEINLTSNRHILDIFGKNHPLNHYLKHHVPVVLSTDDEGILRTDLTHQYVEAVMEHGLNYPTIKTINRNALTYSFLKGPSLWANANAGIRVKACEILSSESCKQFIKNSEKATLQWQLEQDLIAFEQQYWTSHGI